MLVCGYNKRKTKKIVMANDELVDDKGEEEEAGPLLDEDTKGIMEGHDLDEAAAERVLELMEDYGVDEDEAVDLETEI